MQEQFGRNTIVTPLKKENWPKDSREFDSMDDAKKEAERLARNGNIPVAIFRPVEIFVPRSEVSNFGDLTKQSSDDSLNPRLTPVG